MDLDKPCNQTEFGDLVGISQQAVSELVARGVLGSGQLAQTWLHAYTRHLREQAAGRGSDGELAAKRAAESDTRNQLLQIKLRKARGEYAEVALIEQVLATIGAQISSRLEPLPARVKMLLPEISAERLKSIEAAITDARNLAVTASLAVLDHLDPDEDVDDQVSAT
jgi:phage terminase Nu1 subunit (DNA packaging protein)